MCFLNFLSVFSYIKKFAFKYWSEPIHLHLVTSQLNWWSHCIGISSILFNLLTSVTFRVFPSAINPSYMYASISKSFQQIWLKKGESFGRDSTQSTNLDRWDGWEERSRLILKSLKNREDEIILKESCVR